tara:strand:- start:4909 stop:6543 length:1635 start_codon:yes stop_codon:yes gene_type:complete
MDSEYNPMPEAVLVENGVIKSIGATADIMASKPADTKVIDLNGRTLMPGFIAVHSHPNVKAAHYSFVDLSAYENDSPEQVWEKLESAIKSAKKGEWVFAKGLDVLMMPELTAPSLEYMDKIAPDNPLYIFSQMLHSAWANSQALQEMGITRDTPNPAADSYYEKDTHGNLTGYIHETAAIKPIGKWVLENIDIKENVVSALDDYPHSGVTTISTLGLMDNDGKLMYLYDHLSSEKKSLDHSLLEFIGVLPKKKPTVRHFVYVTDEGQHLLPDSVDNGDDFFKVLGVKFWYDGSGSTGSMYNDAPYLVSHVTQNNFRIAPDYKGKNIYDEGELYNKIKPLHDAGWQLAVHAIGDRANKETIRDLARVVNGAEKRDHRHRVEHVVLMPSAHIPPAADAGLTFSFQINYLYYYGSILQDSVIGEPRTQAMLPIKSTLDNGVRFTLHADAPAFPGKPLSLVQAAVTRTSASGLLVGENEAVPVWEALKAVTINAAWQLHMDENIGSIEEGKYADLVILDKNPLKVAPNELRDIEIVKTYVHGNLLYQQ